jgi:ABC-2 type transport system ATP-binding protein
MINKGQIVALDSPDNLKNSITGTRIVEVTFSSVVSESKLSEIEGVLEVHKLGDRYKLVVGGESDIVRALVDYAKIWNTRITALNTLKPSLEDAFLRITGLIPMMENGSRDHKRAD